MEQDGLVVVEEAVNAPVMFTMDKIGTPPDLLLPIFGEYKKTPLFLHVVWRTRQAPTTSDLSQFGGKKIKQYWDPNGKTPSLGGRLRVNGQLIEMDRLGLRMALAHAAAFPQ